MTRNGAELRPQPAAQPDDGYGYVREHYGVEVQVGQRVVIDGTPAVILRGENDHYLHFTPNGHNHLIAHPTWRVDYYPEEAEHARVR